MRTWPAELPIPTSECEYQLRDGLSDPDALIDPYRTRTYPEWDASFKVHFTAAEFEIFREWFEDALNGGSELFTADWLTAAGFDHHMLRFRDDPWEGKRVGVEWDITINVEIVSGVPVIDDEIAYGTELDDLETGQ